MRLINTEKYYYEPVDGFDKVDGLEALGFSFYNMKYPRQSGVECSINLKKVEIRRFSSA